MFFLFTLLRRGPVSLIVSGLCLFFLMLPYSSQAGPLSFPIVLTKPTGSAVLTIDGAITRTNSADSAQLDLNLLLSLPLHTLRTSTSVTDGTQVFEGVLMRDVLELVGATGTIVRAQALNHYSIDIPIEDFYKYDVLLALSMDGERLLPSGKGPLWIVYPRDNWRQLQDIRYDYRWVWQLHRLTIQ